jgi:UDP:flavonoid glycosyltransferase YjiC (YdhE family)
MDMLDTAPIRWLPDGFRVKLSEMLLGVSHALISRSFNQVAVEYGLEPFDSFDEVLWRGSYQLVAEPPGFSALQFPPTAHFIGPLIARLDAPLPEKILNLPRDLPIVYFAMGSSGRPGIAARIVAGFAGKPYRVIAPVKYLLEKQSVQIPDNVLVTDWLPALEANRLADIAVTHGGHGTVMNACLSGKPVVGVAMSPEQLLNLECLAAKGFAIRIPIGSLTAERLCASIDRLLADPSAQARASEYRKVVEEWDTPQHIRRFFCETFGR